MKTQKERRFPCNQKDCYYKGDTKQHLNEHLWRMHKVGEGKEFNCEQCDYKTRYKQHFNSHLRRVHDIGKITIFKCTEEKCPYEAKDKGDLNKHLKRVHKIGEVKSYNCTEEKCDFETVYPRSLKNHLWEVHDIGKGELYKCEKKGCEYVTKNKYNFNNHLRRVHDIGEITIFKCTEENCPYETKDKGDIIKHLWRIHDKGDGKIYYCPDENCEFETKYSSVIKNHLSFVHDIGDKTCEFCYSNVFSLTPYEDSKTKIKSQICRKCYKNNAGFTSRIEKQMVEHLKKNYKLKPYFVLEDSIIKGNKCNTKRRPDTLLSSTTNLHVIVECDENQHRGYIKTCEESRINEILDEIPEGPVSIVRWNPDHYEHIIDDKKDKKKNRNERLEILENLILKISKKEIKDDNFIIIYYLFYSVDNEIITNNFKKVFIYDNKDVENIF